MRQRVDVMGFCSRKGYCKDGYCSYRAGDLTPRVDTRPEVFALTSVATPATPCGDGYCPGNATCSQNATMLAVRAPGRGYREDEVLIAPRECVRLVLRLGSVKCSAAHWCDAYGCHLEQGRPETRREPGVRPHAVQHPARQPPMTSSLCKSRWEIGIALFRVDWRFCIPITASRFPSSMTLLVGATSRRRRRSAASPGRLARTRPA